MSFCALLRASRHQFCRRSGHGFMAMPWRPASVPLCSSASTVTGEQMMPFEEYTKSKKRLKNVKRVMAIPFGMGGTLMSGMVAFYFHPDFMDLPPEQVEPIMGMDPMIFYSLLGCVSGGICYLAGTYVVGAMYSMIWRRESEQLIQRDKDFFARLARHRFSRESGFEDDYYGEKIKTVSDYRQWIRAQQKRRLKITGTMKAQPAARAQS